VALRGLTWDHPRGAANLRAAARLPEWSELGMEWHTQPLEGFESASLERLAADYDLLVIDHPHLGAAEESGALRDLADLFARDELDRWRSDTVGASFDSYRLDGSQWALPVDAATQVAAYRPSRLDPAELPATWPEVAELARTRRVALSLAGPHALLGFASICVALGERPGEEPDRFVSEPTAAAALEVMRACGSGPLAETIGDNPIALLERMSGDPSPDGIDYCPLVYGYVGYSGARVRFADVPAGPGGRGSTLGGTGIALSRRCDPTPRLLDFVRWLMSPDAQAGFIPAHEGQPALRAAWTDEAVDRRAHRFYRDTLATIETAWVRPRFDGFIGFQSAASARIREHLVGEADAEHTINLLDAEYRAARRPEGVSP
jgi:multiple sugar transport system substrate-binding protein